MRWLSFYRSSPDASSGPTYTQATFGYVVQTQDGAEGVVDVGLRSDYATLREAIAAQALDRLVAQCGDQADVPLEGLHLHQPLLTRKKYSAWVLTIRLIRKKPVAVAKACRRFLCALRRRKWATANRWCGLGSQQA